ncbi:EIF3L isoform 6, partial [Pongo abelii]
FPAVLASQAAMSYPADDYESEEIQSRTLLMNVSMNSKPIR